MNKKIVYLIFALNCLLSGICFAANPFSEESSPTRITNPFDPGFSEAPTNPSAQEPLTNPFEQGFSWAAELEVDFKSYSYLDALIQKLYNDSILRRQSTYRKSFRWLLQRVAQEKINAKGWLNFSEFNASSNLEKIIRALDEDNITEVNRIFTDVIGKSRFTRADFTYQDYKHNEELTKALYNWMGTSINELFGEDKFSQQHYKQSINFIKRENQKTQKREDAEELLYQYLQRGAELI